MLYGTIVKYLPEKQFGFIRNDVGRDVFFHATAIDSDGPPSEVIPGQPVAYELARKVRQQDERETSGIAPRSNGPRASKVEFIDQLPGGTIEEMDADTRVKRHPKARRKKPSWRR